MITFLVIFGQVFTDLKKRTNAWLPWWLSIGGIIVSGSAAFFPKLAISSGVFFLLFPIAYLLSHTTILSFKFSKDQGLLVLYDRTQREFYKNGHVHESWAREIRNLSGKKTADIFDVPMFWDIPLDQIHPLTLHVSKKNAQNRYETKSQIFKISHDSPAYSERLFEGRKFYGCVFPVPLGLDSGESMIMKFIYKHIINTPKDDQIIRSLPRLLRLIWEGNANDGLKFDPTKSYIEVRYPDPTSAVQQKETNRAIKYLKFSEADTRMIFDLPMPKSGFHYRIVFCLEDLKNSND